MVWSNGAQKCQTNLACSITEDNLVRFPFNYKFWGFQNGLKCCGNVSGEFPENPMRTSPPFNRKFQSKNRMELFSSNSGERFSIWQEFCGHLNCSFWSNEKRPMPEKCAPVFEKILPRKLQKFQHLNFLEISKEIFVSLPSFQKFEWNDLLETGLSRCKQAVTC